MIAVLVAVVVVVGIALLIALYLTLLGSLYPEYVRTNEVHHVRTNDLWVLRVCRYRKSRASGEPVLLVHGMGANQHNFTSPEDGCLVDYLCDKGYDCWTIDLRGARSSMPPFERTRNDVRMEDFFTEDLPAVINHVLRHTNYQKLHWVGHSMGGMLLYAYTQYADGAQIASGTTLGSPIDFKDAVGKVPMWLLSFGEKCPAAAGSVIRGAVPLARAVGGGIQAFPINQKNVPQNMHVGHFINMLEDPLSGLTAQVKEWMRTGAYTLLDGKLDIAAGLPDLPVPLLAFYAAHDPFVDAERALNVFNAIKIEDKKAIVCAKENGFVEDYNHCDLAFSREAAKEIFEPIAQWLAEHPCPLRLEEEDGEPPASATILSPDKRAEILSGAAFAHVTNDAAEESAEADATQAAAMEMAEAAAPSDEPDAVNADAMPSVEDNAQDATSEKPDDAPSDAAAGAATDTTAKPAAKKKAPAKKKASAKKTTAKKASAKKTAAARKKAPAKKKSVTKQPAKKKAAAKSNATSSAAKNAAESDEPKVSPEDQERADRLREERNVSFTDIMASLNESGDAEK